MLSSLHIDLNGFFATVEQTHRLELRGRPVAVVPMMVETTFVLAASYPAKAKGVKTGTRVSEALTLCPDLVLVQSEPGRYVRAHHRVIEAVNRVWPVHQVWSIDELECRLTGPQREPEAALDLARRIKRSILQNAGACLTCSIGIGPSQLIAKLGTDLQKPDGLVMMQKHELPQRLFPLGLTEICGIGPRMERRLMARGVNGFEDLAALSPEQFVRVWGSIDGLRYHRAIHGLDYTDARTVRRTIGHEHVLPPDKRSIDGARGVLARLLHKAAWRARDEGYVAGRMHLWAGTDREQSWESQCELEPPTNQTSVCTKAMLAMWDTFPRRCGTPRKVGVTLLNLEPLASATMPLFEPVEPRPRQTLDKAMDAINAKFGRYAVHSGAVDTGRADAAPPIAFRRVPGLNET